MSGKAVGRGLVGGSAAAMLLVTYGAVTHPLASKLSAAAALMPPLLYAALGWRLLRIKRSHTLVTVAGMLAGTVFAGEIIGEYLVLPAENIGWGAVEFGLAFLIYAVVAVIATVRGRSYRETVTEAALTAVMASLIWCIVVLSTFYVFEGSARQSAVLTAEGDFADFRASGGADFSAFIMEDFFGATFFHLLLGPILSAMIASLIWGMGRGLLRLTGRSRLAAGPERR